MKPHWFNYVDAFERGNLLPYFRISVVILCMTTSLTVAISSLAGYGLRHSPRRMSVGLLLFSLRV